MTATLHPTSGPELEPTPLVHEMRRLSSWSPTTWAVLIAVLAVVLRLPFVTLPLGSDEGGFLLVASQWKPGASLYGNYWVDRPPLLLDFFSLADQLGGAIALRLLGAALVALSVLLAARIGAAAIAGGGGTRWAPVLTAGTAATFLVNPLFGALEVNGELIAVPLILLSVEHLVRATTTTDVGTRSWLLLAAGAAAAAAVLVKQNEVDALLLTAVLAAGVARRSGVLVAARAVALQASGAVLCTAAVLAHALTRGTTLPGLWEAVVTFRLDASGLISSSASPATSSRLEHILLALVVSGAPVIVALLVLRLRGSWQAGTPDLRLPAGVLLLWECLSVLGGGSYWSHYLIVLVPGLVLAVAATCATTPRAAMTDHPHAVRAARPSALIGVLTYAGLACLVALGIFSATTSKLHAHDSVIAYLAAHKQPGETAMIAYGHPDVLEASGMSSPYTELWSLPVRVRDPHLHELTDLLAGPSRPDWVVTTGTSLQSWGLDASTAQAQLDAHYRYLGEVDGNHIFYRLTPPEPTTSTERAP